MRIPIYLEPIANRGFVARSATAPIWTAEGSTKDEAERHLTELIATRLREGWECRIIDIPVSNGEHPLASAEGIFKDDPQFDEWQQAIKDNRERDEGEANASGSPTNPILQFAGMFEDDPAFDRWVEGIEEYRREANRVAD